MVLLKNDEISIKINEKGAEIVEGKYASGEDFIWVGDEMWPDHSSSSNKYFRSLESM